MPAGTLLFPGADFEGADNVTYSELGWTAEGDFTNQPVSTGTILDQQAVSGFLGSQLVNSFFGKLINRDDGDTAIGSLTSPAFTINKPYINFLVGGGNNPYGKENATAVVLLVNGEVKRSATGKSSESLNWTHWDISEFQGQQAKIVIIDENSGGWGHILLDEIIQSDQPKQTANWADFGSDFYAAVSWNGVPDGKRYWLAWMSNWSYAGSVPTTLWRGGQTFARELKLQTIGDQIRLTQVPVEQMIQLRDKPLYELKEATLLAPGEQPLTDAGVDGQVYEIEASIKPENATEVGFKLRSGNNGEVTLVGYDALAGEVYLDRSKSGDSSFDASFAARHRAPLPLLDGKMLKLRILVDTSSVTVFSGDGEVVLTDLIFPDPASTGIEMYSPQAWLP
ncbi:MAG: GH32 C-terminal domain-containing protein [Chania sp.]